MQFSMQYLQNESSMIYRLANMIFFKKFKDELGIYKVQINLYLW